MLGVRLFTKRLIDMLIFRITCVNFFGLSFARSLINNTPSGVFRVERFSAAAFQASDTFEVSGLCNLPTFCVFY